MSYFITLNKVQGLLLKIPNQVSNDGGFKFEMTKVKIRNKLLIIL